MSQRELDVILADLDRIGHALDPKESGLGEEIINLAVAGILRGMDEQRSPSGEPWAPLSEAYEEEKARIAPGSPMAVLHGKMKTEAEIRGTGRVEGDRVVLEYGTSEETRAEATWFQEGDGAQPGRPFYALSAETIQAIDEFLTRQLDQAMGGP